MQNIVVEIVNDRVTWNAFVAGNTTETFHQSWEWGEVYRKDNHLVWYVGAYLHNELIAVCLTVKIKAKRGVFLLVPHGPVFNINASKQEVLKALTKHLVDLAKKEMCVFVRIAPVVERTPENKTLFEGVGFRKAPIFVQSEQSWVLDITPEPHVLLKNMRKSTRHILKNKDVYDVECRRSTLSEDIDLFCSLYNKTVANQGFFGQSTHFIKIEFETFMQSSAVSLYFAYHKSKPVAAAFVIEQNKTGFYHYGASVRLDTYVPAPHTLQWFIIEDLKSRGFQRYNFWGIAPENKPRHPWAGLSLFKKGFGGEPHTYTQTQDYVIGPAYWLNWVVETIRSARRGY